MWTKGFIKNRIMDLKKMVALVQVYIHHKTNKEVNITPSLPKDMVKLMLAHSVASRWCNENLIT